MTYQQTERWQLSQFPNETQEDALRDAEKRKVKQERQEQACNWSKAEPMDNARKA